VRSAASRCASESETGWLDQTAVNELLRLTGVEIPPSKVAADADAVAQAATAVGFPVVLKAQVTGLLHKSDEGAVVLDVRDTDDARAVAATFKERFGERLSGVFVQHQVGHGVELLIGANRSPLGLPVIVVGAGGTDAEILDDQRVCIAPLTHAQAREALLSLRLAPMLTGYRTHPPVPIDDLASLVCRIGLLVAVTPQLVELELNPVIATASSVIAVDARIKVTNQPETLHPLQAMRR
jgi:succinyl-CoA synthetase beta subunit